MNLSVVILNAFILVAVLSVFMMYLLFFVISRQLKMDISLNKRQFHNDVQSALSLGGYSHAKQQNNMKTIIREYEQKAKQTDKNNQDWNNNMYEQSIWLSTLLFLLMIAYSIYGVSFEKFNANIVLQTFIMTLIIVIISQTILYYAICKDYKHVQLETMYTTVLQNFLSTNSNYKSNSLDKKSYCENAL